LGDGAWGGKDTRGDSEKGLTTCPAFSKGREREVQKRGWPYSHFRKGSREKRNTGSERVNPPMSRKRNVGKDLQQGKRVLLQGPSPRGNRSAIAKAQGGGTSLSTFKSGRKELPDESWKEKGLFSRFGETEEQVQA